LNEAAIHFNLLAPGPNRVTIICRETAFSRSFADQKSLMLLPGRASVKPRVFVPESGEVLPLEDELQVLVAAGTRGSVQLLGPPGSGKTMALQHLAAVLPTSPRALFLDEPDPAEISWAAEKQLVIFAASSPQPGPHRVTYSLAPWGRDELIEYLLAAHRPTCGAVMDRLTDADLDLFGGIPELWGVVLPRLAADPLLPNSRSALHQHLASLLLDGDLIQRARSACLTALTAGNVDEPTAVEHLALAGFSPEPVRILRHAEVQRLLAAERIKADLQTEAACDYLASRLPRALVRATASILAGDGSALERLRDLLAGPPWSHPMAASLLHGADSTWVPAPGCVPVLGGAYLERAAWPGVHLPSANLQGADLSEADLRGACLDQADASKADLRGALLACSSLNRFKAIGANLRGADLSAACGEAVCLNGAKLVGANLVDAALVGASLRGADLRGASLVGADLTRAVLIEAEIEDAYLTGAQFERANLAGLPLRKADCRGACFRRADLHECDLEGIDCPGGDFRQANLQGALLTGASMARALFTGACLRNAGLGDVTWEGVCLRHADLRGATFHMGTTRSGLLFTPIASEGTRTGFYTDDSEEQHFKAPEEIRKANLCGVDLRRANVEDVDFYLVDLRGAVYDETQGRYFRRCRAILENRC
jgi:uncharacterized protein YjbI with pentapeptide repeats